MSHCSLTMHDVLGLFRPLQSYASVDRTCGSDDQSKYILLPPADCTTLSSFQMNTDNAYESVLNAEARRNRYNRDIRKRREALARRKLQISSGPILRSLKTAVRKALAKERASSLWILPADIDFHTMHQSHYAQASLLGLPAELRQKILLLSFDIRDIIPHSSQGP